MNCGIRWSDEDDVSMIWTCSAASVEICRRELSIDASLGYHALPVVGIKKITSEIRPREKFAVYVSAPEVHATRYYMSGKSQFRLVSVSRFLLRTFFFSFFFVISDFFLYILFCSYFSGLACVVVFSYAVRWHFTCFILELAIYMVFFLVFLCLTVCDHRISISLG